MNILVYSQIERICGGILWQLRSVGKHVGTILSKAPHMPWGGVLESECIVEQVHMLLTTKGCTLGCWELQ